MEMASGSPPAEVDIGENPDVLPTSGFVKTEVSDKWMEIDALDIIKAVMEVTGGSTPAEVDICENPDMLPIARSVTTEVSGKCLEFDTPDTVESGMEWK